jgi:hypothetical protein
LARLSARDSSSPLSESLASSAVSARSEDVDDRSPEDSEVEPDSELLQLETPPLSPAG